MVLILTADANVLAGHSEIRDRKDELYGVESQEYFNLKTDSNASSALSQTSEESEGNK